MNETAKLVEAVARDAAERQVVVPSGVPIAPIARAHGGWYEGGAWRFTSPAKKLEFERALEDANGQSSSSHG